MSIGRIQQYLHRIMCNLHISTHLGCVEGWRFIDIRMGTIVYKLYGLAPKEVVVVGGKKL